MIKKEAYLFFSLLFLILSLIVPKIVRAEVYFYDDFSSDFSSWELINGGHSNSSLGVLDSYGFTLDDGRLKGEANGGEWSTIYSNKIDFTNFVLESDVINTGGIDMPFYLRVSPDKNNFYMVDYRFYDTKWPDNNNVTLWKMYQGNWVYITASYDAFISQNIKHHIKIVMNGPRIVAYFDDLKVIDYTDGVNVLTSGGIAVENWGGSYPGKIINYFDYIRVADINDPMPTISITPSVTDSPQPSPTPTQTPSPTETPVPTPTAEPTAIPTLAPTSTMIPTPTATLSPTQTPTMIPTLVPKREKVIVIPGLGASWNTPAMVGNIDLPNDQWKLLTFVHNYDGLLNTLKNKGYHDSGTDQDLFLWAYDWRDKVSDISKELDDYINKNVKVDEEFVLIGHSLGGLVARIWAQEHLGDTRLKKVVTLGSPHEGTLKSYEVWAGGVIPKDWGWKAVALNVLLEIQKQRFLTTVNEIHSVAPVLKDINPTFDFLKKKSGVIEWKNTTGANIYLDNKNKSVMPNNLFTIAALGQTTKRWIMAEERSFVDKILMRWVDGKPISYLVDDGDGTVLAKSAGAGEVSDYSVQATHTDMMDPSIIKIEELLNLNIGNEVGSISSNLDDSLIFFIGSPAYIEVSCNNGTKISSDVDGFVVIKNQEFSICELEVKGTGSGTYHLVTGGTNNFDDWNYYEGEIVDGQKKNYVFNVYQGLLSGNRNIDINYELINRDIGQLLLTYKNNIWLKKALAMSTKKNPEALLSMMFNFRRMTKESFISRRIIGYVGDILAPNHHQITRGLAKALTHAGEINGERLTKRLSVRGRLSNFEIGNVELVDEIMKRMTRNLEFGQYKGMSIDSLILENLVKENW